MNKKTGAVPDFPAVASETTTYLEMLDRGALKPSATDRGRLVLARLGPDDWQRGRQMYKDVGNDWLWIDRLSWPADSWREYYARPDIELWVADSAGAPAGYFELSSDDEGNTELAYFGLMPACIGKGLGGLLLTLAIERAWDAGARRVWVHTSSRDHAQALPNYLARGFRIYQTETRHTPTRNPAAS
jgi:GNAT superfamily N-acetyltransferase